MDYLTFQVQNIHTNFLNNFSKLDHKKHTKFNKFLVVISVVVTIRMATVQHLVIANRKRRPIICIIKLELNKTFKETTKATEVA